MRTTVLTILMFASFSVSAASVGDTTRVEYGQIIGIKHVKLSAHTGTGATLGGLAGLAASRHEDSRDRNKNVAAGLLIGALIAKAANKGHDGEEYTVALRNGSEVTYTTERRDLVNGDCVAVEQGKHINLRRVAHAMCDQPTVVTAPYHAADQAEAIECQTAKAQLLASSDEDSAKAAAVKVEILCHH